MLKKKNVCVPVRKRRCPGFQNVDPLVPPSGNVERIRTSPSGHMFHSGSAVIQVTPVLSVPSQAQVFPQAGGTTAAVNHESSAPFYLAFCPIC